jgi:pimeloyl-ACP methyl ester carboxylesterase
MEKITNSLGNSPIHKYPSDYHPEGCGFWFELSEGLDSGKKLFFRDSTHGKGDPKKTIVFIHGNPENSYTYRKVIKHLVDLSKEPIRIVAMDHIGFGLSDQATYEMVCMDHADNLLQLIRHLNLKNVTLVIHDWGGPIGIGAFLKVPEKVSNLIILNTTVFPLPETGLRYETYPGSWLNWAKGPRIIPNRLWGSFAAFIIFLKPTGTRKLFIKLLFSLILKGLGIFSGSKKVAQKLFKKQFKPKLNALSSKRLVRQTPTWGYGNTYVEPELGERDTAPFYSSIQENISKLWGPNGQNIGIRAVLGKWDPCAKDEVIDQWIEHFPQLDGHVQEFQDISHFIEEIKHNEISEAIIDVAELG